MANFHYGRVALRMLCTLICRAAQASFPRNLLLGLSGVLAVALFLVFRLCDEESHA
ncbi:MAG TPA: hypothetical protein VLM37_07595 [Fibrobacteraceae bacterium]|nr:hypothetical protein [Fibrobacteraceae bacterium]